MKSKIPKIEILYALGILNGLKFNQKKLYSWFIVQKTNIVP